MFRLCLVRMAICRHCLSNPGPVLFQPVSGRRLIHPSFYADPHMNPCPWSRQPACACSNDLTNAVQILHSPRCQSRSVARVLTPPAACANLSSQVSHLQQPLLPTSPATPNSCPVPLARTPHPLWPEGPPAAGLRLLDPAGAP